MKKDLVDITLVVDRSGSMEAIREDAEGGVNTFLAEQSKESGEVLVTLLQFDTEYEFVHRGVPLRKVPRYRLVPRGCTALLDAVGRAINETGERLAKMDERNRPGLVVFVVMTDGQENSSHEFSTSQIKEMIERQQKQYNWQFIFLGANQDAFAEASEIGIQTAGVADFVACKMAAAWQGTASHVKRMRKQRSADQTVVNSFTPEEREAMK